MYPRLLKSWISGLAIGGVLAFTIHAKPVSVQWEPVEEADRYELKITQGDKTHFSGIFDKKTTSWKGDLPPGLYVYRVRAVDFIDRPGKWTDAHALLSPPDAPKLREPQDNKIYSGLAEGTEITLTWHSVALAQDYQVRVFLNDKKILEDKTANLLYVLKDLKEGTYRWEVRSHLYGERDLPKTILSRQVPSPYSGSRKFQVTPKQLNKPTLLSPKQAELAGDIDEVTLQWTQVPDAEGYEVWFVEKETQSSDKPKRLEMKVLSDTELTVQVDKHTAYSWSVQAIDEIDDEGRPRFRGETARGEFRVGGPEYRYYPFLISANFGLSTFDYILTGASFVESTASDTPIAAVLGLGVQYWPWRWLGLEIGSQGSLLFLSNTQLIQTHQAGFSLRHFWGNYETPWSVSIQAFLQSRGMYVAQSGSVGNSLDPFQATGIVAGFSVEKRLSQISRVGFSGQGFYPLSIQSAPTGARLTHELREWENLRANLFGAHRISPTLEFQLTLFAELQAISFELIGQSASEVVAFRQMGALGSLIWRLGR